jgi:hypothetical protein
MSSEQCQQKEKKQSKKININEARAQRSKLVSPTRKAGIRAHKEAVEKFSER